MKRLLLIFSALVLFSSAAYAQESTSADDSGAAAMENESTQVADNQTLSTTSKTPFAGHGIRMEFFAGYVPVQAGMLGLNVGYKFKNKKSEHFALGLYGQVTGGIGAGYSLFPAGISWDVDAIVKFHIINKRFVFSPFVGLGVGFNGLLLGLWPVGFAYFDIRAGVSLDLHVGKSKRGFIGLDLGLVEAFSSAYMPDDYHEKNCQNSTSGACSSLTPWPALPQGYVALHFGFYFQFKPKKNG